jgi:hypothetical protein
MPTADTGPEAQALQPQALRRLTGPQRVLMALETSLFARELARVQICRKRPEWTKRQTARELIWMSFLPGEPPSPWR